MSWLNYSLDDQSDVALTIIRQYADGHHGPGHYEIALCTLPTLAEGLHYIHVHGESTFNATLDSTTYFTAAQVITTPSPVIPSPSPTPTQATSTISPTPSPTVPELSWLAFLPLCLIVLSVALVLKRRNLLSA
ncbi:MAG: hypothetical protein NWE92_01330 [Candidatus Bathyarchaeota archaeon]|nr:hypothetical protein [Candidatus Bathyarchaeota archaeon]